MNAPKTWAIVPVHGFENAKSRLAATLTDSERKRLAAAMFEHVFFSLRQAALIDQIFVLSESAEIISNAQRQGADTKRDELRGLGVEVNAALAAANNHGATQAVVVMADLPQLAPAEIDNVVRHLGSFDWVLCPDRELEGTNLLGAKLPLATATCFGNRNSYALHLNAAAEANLNVAVLLQRGCSRDIDTPAHYLELQKHRPNLAKFEPQAAQLSFCKISQAPLV